MTKNTQSLVRQAETKIQEILSLIENYEKQLASHKNQLQPFIKQLAQIKENMKLKNNQNNALSGVNNTK